MNDNVKNRLRHHVRQVMEAARIPPSVRPHFQDRLLRGGVARAKAAGRGGVLWTGTEIFWPRAGVADVGILELPAPARGEVLVKTDITAVSPGTERALLNLMPGTSPKFPLRPGYSGAGTVVRVGSGVTGFKAGDRVVCTDTIHHASLALVRQERTFALPAGATPEAAALLQLLVIAQFGVLRGEMKPGGRVVIVGAGLIGQFAAQLAQLAGAGSVTMIASSSTKRQLSLRSGADRFIDVSRESSLIDSLEADLVIEVSGNPEGLSLAVGAAGRRGRVVLLGSTRGVNRSVNFDQLVRQKGLSLAGAHISMLGDQPTPACPWSYRETAVKLLESVTAGELTVSHLINDVINPLEAPVFYKRLCRGDRAIVGALFDWRRLNEGQRCRRSFALLPPKDLFRKGRSFDQSEGLPSIVDRTPSWLGGDVLPGASAQGVVRFGLIGCGGMGVRHAAAIRSAPNACLTATMDLDARLARELAAGAFHTTKLDELLGRADVDAVVIVTPNHLHESIGLQAANAGKHVIVEKPMAHNLESADRLREACRQAGVALSVGYAFRHNAEIRAARRLVERNLIGKVLSVQLTCYLDKPPSYYGSGATNRTHSDWRASLDGAGGGVLIMNMSHQLDQIRYIVGDDLAAVSSVTGVLDAPDGVEVEDVVAVAGEFENGAVACFFGACFARGIANQTEIQIIGDAGTLVLDNAPRFMSLRGSDDLVSGRWHSFGKLPNVNAQVAYIAAFADAILSGDISDIDGSDGRAVQAWMHAIYESARHRVPVRVQTRPELHLAAVAASL